MLTQTETIRERFTQIKDDWRQRPFVDIEIADDSCGGGPSYLFSRQWGGTQRGCEYLGSILTQDDYIKETSSPDGSRCSSISPKSSIS